MAHKSFLSVTETAALLGISRTHVLRKIKEGKLAAHRVGKSYIIPFSALPDIHQPITPLEKKQMEAATEEVMKEFGEVIRKLGHT